MARTAPAPNLPAIPGMNPGVFVAGGGAGGAGGGGGDGGGDGNDGSGTTEGGGSDATGGGKNAASCGPGSGAGCPNPIHGNGGTAAGDPVDVLTGRVYTVGVVDLALPGPLPLIIQRAYSSDARNTDVGLGHGWSHSLAWRIDERRRRLRVWQPDAAPTDAAIPEVGVTVSLPCGALTKVAGGYALDAGDGMLRVFAPDPGRRGRYLLARIVDASGNAIALHYAGRELVSVIDSVGRVVRVRRSAGGRIAAFEVHDASAPGRWTSFRTYRYDARGDLAAAVDGEGYAVRFAYDDAHAMTMQAHPSGLTVEYRYDESGRCTETWCHRVGGDDALDADVPRALSDGHTRAKGFLHCKMDYGPRFTTVTTSRTFRTYETGAAGWARKVVSGGAVHRFERDGAGHVLAYRDSGGHDWRFDRDARGRLVRHVDPLGATTEYTYDDAGRVTEARDAVGGFTRYARDAAGRITSVDDAAGNVVTFEYDGRGQLTRATLPDGGVTEMRYDALGNRVAVVEPDGTWRQIRYDFLGRPQSFVDERGHETAFAYDRCGRLRVVQTATGTWTRDYDADGKLVRMVDADGRATVLVRGGYGVVTEVVRPDGTRVRYRYDREQDLVRVVNELGDEHVLERDARGRVVEERTFDGRVVRYDYDAEGRIVRIDRKDGAVAGTATELEYDAVGRLLRRVHADDRVDTFAYDAVGRLVGAESAGTLSEFAYDARGNVVAERVTHDGESYLVRSAFDAVGRRVRVERSDGSSLWVRRDAAGRPLELGVGAEVRVGFTWAGGDEVERVLPGGGRVVRDIDLAGRTTRVAVLASAGAPGAPAGEPQWVGARGAEVTLARGFGWSAGGELRSVGDQEARRVDVERDVNGRVTARRDGHALIEAWRYGASGDPFEAGGPRRAYASGGRPLACGATEYRYDDRGRVVEKRVAVGDGAERAVRTWSLHWREDGLLDAVDTPERARVAFAYDAFARRVSKRVTRDGQLIASTRFDWDGDVLVHERTVRRGAAGEEVVVERGYAGLPGDLLPLAQRDDVAAGGRSAGWSYFVYGANGFPDALVGDDGSVRAVVDGSLYGRVPDGSAQVTPLRFPGQYADAETGFYDNRNRIFDPETGHYLSPEPLGLEGSLKPYAYVDDYPLDWVDPDALKTRMVATITLNDGTTLPGAKSGGISHPSELHPAVQAALPPSNARPLITKPDGRVVKDDTPEWACAEPAALSKHLNAWEERNPPRTCRPSDPNFRANLASAMSEIKPDGGIASSFKGVPRAACPNCSQTIPRLYTLAGLSPPNGVIAPGARANGTPNVRTTEPVAGFYKNETNAALSNYVDPLNSSVPQWPHGLPEDPGVWSYTGGRWNKKNDSEL